MLSEILIRHLWSVSWQVSILIGIIWLIDRLSVRASSLFRYWLWCIVLVRLCIPVSFELPTGVVPSFGAAAYMKVPSPRTMPVLRTLPGSYEPMVSLPTLEKPARKAYWQSIDPRQIFFFVWLLTVTGIALALLAHVFLTRRRLNRCRPIENPALIALVERLARAMGILRPVQLIYLDPSIGDIPAVAGIVRPRIFLPPDLADEWLTGDLEPILLYELAHIRRCDLLVNWLQIVVQTIFFFHPLVWYVNRRIRLLREEICDNIAVSFAGDNRRGYTLGMLRVVEQALHEPSLGFVGIGFTERKSTLRARITRILSDRYKVVIKLSLISFLSLLLIGIFSFCVSCKKSKHEIKVVKPPTIELVLKKGKIEDNSVIQLHNHENIIENTLRVIVNSDTLSPGSDYKYDSSKGNIQLLSEKARTPEADIGIIYKSNNTISNSTLTLEVTDNGKYFIDNLLEKERNLKEALKEAYKKGYIKRVIIIANNTDQNVSLLDFMKKIREAKDNSVEADTENIFNYKQQKRDEKHIVIEINRKGEYIVEGVSTPAESLVAVVEKALKENPRPILIRADLNAKHGNVLQLMRLVRSIQDRTTCLIDIINPSTKQAERAELSLADSVLVDGILVKFNKNESDRAGELSKRRPGVIRLTSKVIENSLRVVLNGDTLTAGKDYTFDPSTQEITLLNKKAMSPTADLVVKYEEAHTKETPWIDEGIK